jgi:hypothetical protein
MGSVGGGLDLWVAYPRQQVAINLLSCRRANHNHSIASTRGATSIGARSQRPRRTAARERHEQHVCSAFIFMFGLPSRIDAEIRNDLSTVSTFLTSTGVGDRA